MSVRFEAVRKTVLERTDISVWLCGTSYCAKWHLSMICLLRKFLWSRFIHFAERRNWSRIIYWKSSIKKFSFQQEKETGSLWNDLVVETCKILPTNYPNHIYKNQWNKTKPHWICSYIVRWIGIVWFVVISVKKKAKQNKWKIHFAFYRKKVEWHVPNISLLHKETMQS